MRVIETLPALIEIRDRHAQALAAAEAQGPVHPEIAAPILAIISKLDGHIANITASGR